ncbi:MAG: helix-turn-helix domain-containing protein [Tyzzerella sp.]|nr:helix-turn-helix domain-containing protein [Tyzzerella sp.]
MKIYGIESNEIILREIGIRIRDTRIAIALTQKELAERAGISQRTVERVENGENVKVENIINILRAMQLLQNLDNLIPEQVIRPTELLDGSKKRVRATSKKRPNVTIEWKWGDEE